MDLNLTKVERPEAYLLRAIGTLKASLLCRALATKWKMPAELTLDVAGLALYNVIIMAGARAWTCA